MNAALAHRGPDDSGTYIVERAGVGLGARRLSIIDLEGGHQPLSNEDKTVWAVLNGEIYNHPALIERLRSRGHRFASRTDTEVLVHLYEEFGLHLVHALEGMFAFALWDTRRRRLVLGRDRFGEKPLFYAEVDSVLTFASELTALRAGLPSSPDLDVDAVRSYFVHGYVPGSGTIFEGFHQLGPGQLLTWDHDGRSSSVTTYWSPARATTSSTESYSELVDETTTLLERSVRARMLADVPLGVFLSGGTDSTLIAALAARNSARPIKTFTVGYDQGQVNETAAATLAARALGSDHHEVIMTGADVATRLPKVFASIDQPLADQALVAMHSLAELVRTEVKVAIGGEGADELFGGYPRYRWLARAERLHNAAPSGLLTAVASLTDRLPLPGRASRLRSILHQAPSMQRHVDWVTESRSAIAASLHGPRLRLAAGSSPWPVDLDLSMDPAARLMRLDLAEWLPNDVLVKADRASMMVSLEVRTPYLDRALAEFAQGIPSAIHCRGQGKALLRSVLHKLLPLAGGSRKKTAFRVPAADWLRGPLAAHMAEQLRAGAMFQEGWFDRDAVTRLFQDHLAGRRDWTAALWPTLAFGIWLDHLRGRPHG